jgi:hypothetical protein
MIIHELLEMTAKSRGKVNRDKVIKKSCYWEK